MPINNYLSSGDPYPDWQPRGPLAGMLYPQKMRDYYARRDLQNQGAQIENDFNLAKLGTYTQDAPLRDVTRQRDIMGINNQMERMPGEHQLAMGNLEGDLKAMPHLNEEKVWRAMQKLPDAQRAQALEHLMMVSNIAKSASKIESEEDVDLLVDLMKARLPGYDVSRWARQAPPQAPAGLAPGGPDAADTFINSTGVGVEDSYQQEGKPELTDQNLAPMGTFSNTGDAAVDPNTQAVDIPGGAKTTAPVTVGLDRNAGYNDPKSQGYGAVNPSSSRRIQEMQLLARLNLDNLKHRWDMDKTRYTNDEMMNRLMAQLESAEKMNKDDNASRERAAKDGRNKYLDDLYPRVEEIQKQIARYGVESLTPEQRATMSVFNALLLGKIEAKGQVDVERPARSLGALRDSLNRPEGTAGDTAPMVTPALPGGMDEPTKPQGGYTMNGKPVKVLSETADTITVEVNGQRKTFKKPKKK